MARVFADRAQLEGNLTALGIPFRTVTHAEVRTVDTWVQAVTGVEGSFAKNLFLKDKKDRYYLVSADKSTETSYKVIGRIVGATGGVREADPAKMAEILGTQEGAVTPFALPNDTDKKVVKFLLDKALVDAGKVLFHPLTNAATTEIAPSDLMRFIESHGLNSILQVVDFPEETKRHSEIDQQKVQKKPVAAEPAAKEDEDTKRITVTRSEDLAEWFSQVITKSDMVEYYPDVSGCYILMPWSYSIWEEIQKFFDAKIKKIGVQNCYFPMFVTQSRLNTEKEHIAGFAPEVAWITKTGDTVLPDPIAIRPTSETIMYPTFAKRIRSHRDLPFKINQWCNVVRWEFKHPTPFLRTREFLWQEGHTAHESLEQAAAEVRVILDIYKEVYEELLAVPVIQGQKSTLEKFAGGFYTTSIETMIPANGRGIQAATSHCLGQNFSKMFKIIFEDRAGEKQFAWQNSWGLTTRTIGTMVMVHSDDKGLVLPPRIAPIQVVIVPIFKKNVFDAIVAESKALALALELMGVRVHVDDRDIYTPGWKYNQWELKGVPLRIELGPKDLENRTVRVVRRDNREASVIAWTEITQIPDLLKTIQRDLFNKAKANMDARIIKAANWPDFMTALNARNFVLTPWCERIECEKAVKERSAADSKALSAQEQEILTGAAKTLNLPFEQEPCEGEHCFACGEVATKRALWGRSY